MLLLLPPTCPVARSPSELVCHDPTLVCHDPTLVCLDPTLVCHDPPPLMLCRTAHPAAPQAPSRQ